MNFCQKVLIAVLALSTGMYTVKVNAAEAVFHLGAKHTGVFKYNNDTRGLGIKWDTSAIGAYKHSYANLPNNGALDGYAIYAAKDITSTKKGNLKLSTQAVLTYGYPDWLDANYKGLMLLPTVTMEVGNKKYGIAVSTVPGKLAGGDNAYMLSLIVK